jgi:uncharacterized protein (TIGR02246 family)
MSPDESAVRDLHRTWIDAVNGGDLDRLLSLMTDDVVFVNPGEAPFGRERFRAAFTAGHRDFQIRCASEPEDVVVAGELAHTVSRDTLSLVPRAGGATSRFAGYRLTVYRKQAGRWLLARDAHTVLPEHG